VSLNWVTISSLATAGGTLVLAVATFSSVRSANRTARAAERSLQVALRPLLFQSRQGDPEQKIMFADGHWVKIPGGGAVGQVGSAPAGDVAAGTTGAIEATGAIGATGATRATAVTGVTGATEAGDGGAGQETVYLAMSLHNAGSGLAVLHGWRFYPDRVLGLQAHSPPEEFRMQSRDLYIPVNDAGFWQAAFRDPEDPEYPAALEAIKSRTPVTIDLLYGDYEGGQRVISRFSVVPRRDNEFWLPSVVRHWNVDRPDPRSNPADADASRGPQAG
jgi:hypothetical protein